MFAFLKSAVDIRSAGPQRTAVLSAPKPHSHVAISGLFIAFLVVVGAVAVILILAPMVGGNPPVAPFGVSGDLIDVPPKVFIPGPDKLPNRVFRVVSVGTDMPAAKLNLEPGDLIVAIDSMRFTSMAGFRHALWCSSDRPSFLVWRARAGKLTIQNIPYPHRQPDPEMNRPQPPDSYLMSIDIRD